MGSKQQRLVQIVSHVNGGQAGLGKNGIHRGWFAQSPAYFLQGSLPSVTTSASTGVESLLVLVVVVLLLPLLEPKLDAMRSYIREPKCLGESTLKPLVMSAVSYSSSAVALASAPPEAILLLRP